MMSMYKKGMICAGVLVAMCACYNYMAHKSACKPCCSTSSVEMAMAVDAKGANVSRANAGVVTITKKSELDELIKSGKPALVKAEAVGCQPCEEMNKPYASAAQKYGSRATFAKMDVDKVDFDYKKELKINCMPTTIGYAGGKEQERRMGALTLDELTVLVEQLESPVAVVPAGQEVAPDQVTSVEVEPTAEEIAMAQEAAQPKAKQTPAPVAAPKTSAPAKVVNPPAKKTTQKPVVVEQPMPAKASKKKSTTKANAPARAHTGIQTINSVADLDALIAQGKSVFLKGSGDGCPACVEMEPVFKEYARKYGNEIIFAEFDTDMAVDLRNKFRIEYIPTFVGYKGGKKVFTENGVKETPEMDALIKKLK